MADSGRVAVGFALQSLAAPSPHQGGGRKAFANPRPPLGTSDCAGPAFPPGFASTPAGVTVERNQFSRRQRKCMPPARKFGGHQNQTPTFAEAHDSDAFQVASCRTDQTGQRWSQWYVPQTPCDEPKFSLSCLHRRCRCPRPHGWPDVSHKGQLPNAC